jgi:periplasmic divalent cation tolerance protein
VTTAYVTVPRDAAADLARALVDERLAACVNRVDCASVYRWEGAIHEDDEAILLAKTTADRYRALVDRVRELHPHDVPCIERFDEDAIWEPFGAWRDESVGSGTDVAPGRSSGDALASDSDADTDSGAASDSDSDSHFDSDADEE